MCRHPFLLLLPCLLLGLGLFSGCPTCSPSAALIASASSEKKVEYIPTMHVSAFAGSGQAGHKDGTGTVAQFDRPTSLTIDAAGNLYVAEAGANR